MTGKTGYQGLGERPIPIASYAAQLGRWKMLATDEKPLALYDTEKQYREFTNLLGKQPEIEERVWGEIQKFRSAKRLSWQSDLKARK